MASCGLRLGNLVGAVAKGYVVGQGESTDFFFLLVPVVNVGGTGRFDIVLDELNVERSCEVESVVLGVSITFAENIAPDSVLCGLIVVPLCTHIINTFTILETISTV